MCRVYVFKKKWKRFFAAIIDLIGNCFTFWIRRKFKLPAEKIRKILIVRIDHLGDSLLLRPAIFKLREACPELQIHLITTPENAPLFLLDSFIDRVIPFDGHWFEKETGLLKQMAAFFKMVGFLQSQKYDAAIDFRGDCRANLLLALAAVPVRYGYGVTGGGWLLTHEKPWNDTRHQVLVNCDMLSDFGVNVDSAKRVFNPPVRFPQSAEASMNHSAHDFSSRAYAVIHAGAGNPEKEWPRAHFINLASRILNEKKVKTVYFVGTVAERKRTGEISGDGIIDLRGQTDLHELAGLLSSARFFVGNDSGPAHLAAAQNIPTVVIASATNRIEFWHPWGDRVSVVQSSSVVPASFEDVRLKIDNALKV